MIDQPRRRAAESPPSDPTHDDQLDPSSPKVDDRTRSGFDEDETHDEETQRQLIADPYCDREERDGLEVGGVSPFSGDGSPRVPTSVPLQSRSLEPEPEVTEPQFPPSGGDMPGGELRLLTRAERHALELRIRKTRYKDDDIDDWD